MTLFKLKPLGIDWVMTAHKKIFRMTKKEMNQFLKLVIKNFNFWQNHYTILILLSNFSWAKKTV